MPTAYPSCPSSRAIEPQSPLERSFVRQLRARGFRFLHVIDAVTLFGASMHLITAAAVRIRVADVCVHRTTWAGFSLATLILLSTVYYFGGLYEYEQRLGRPPWLPKVQRAHCAGVLRQRGVRARYGRYLMPRGNLVACSVVGNACVSVQSMGGPPGAVAPIRLPRVSWWAPGRHRLAEAISTTSARVRGWPAAFRNRPTSMSASTIGCHRCVAPRRRLARSRSIPPPRRA